MKFKHSDGHFCEKKGDYKQLSKIMRITLFLFVAFTMQMMATSTKAQDAVVSLRSTNTTVGKLLSEIEKQTDYLVVYSNREVDTSRKIIVKNKSGKVSEYLNDIFDETDINYDFENNYIVLAKSTTRNAKMINEMIEAKAAQQTGKTISGTVADNTGEPIIGATIVVRGDASKGTVTDYDGNFTLTNIPENAVLEISYVGMKPQTIETAGRNRVSVVMEEDLEMLEELVVVGYGTMKKANLTGATTSVKMEDILGDRPVANATSALKGTIPGLQITSGTGEPGAEASISIRGTMPSINGGSPLVLVDNVEMDINMLDPNDIESVSVLKDAASSAIYGARAAFGVILITTKKGLKDDNFRLDYSNNFAFSNARNLPTKASPLQVVSLFKDVGMTNWNDNNVETWLGLINEYNSNPSLNTDGYKKVDNVIYNLKEYNSIDNMMSTFGIQQSHNISASGGGKKSSYRMSIGYVDEDGILITNKDSFTRYNLSSYLSSTAIDWLIPELDIKYTSSKRQIPETNAPYGIWGGAIAFHSYYPIGKVTKDETEYNYNSPAQFIRESFPTTTNVDNIRLFGRITISPIKDLNIIGEYTVNNQFLDKTSFDRIYTYMRAQDNVIENSTTPSDSKFYHTTEKEVYNSLNLYSNYKIKVSNHDLLLMAGFNQERNYWEQFYKTRSEMINQDLPSISGGVGEIFTDDSYLEYTTRSAFYRINYDYKSKYLFEANGRYDGSSKFPKKTRYGFFPSFSVGWRLSEEAFMNWSRDYLDNMKFRGSWGSIGNQNIKPYAYVPGMASYVADWIIDDKRVYSLKMPLLVSRSFTWEKVETLNLGVDINLLSNRLNFNYDIYQRDTKGMLAPGAELPSVVGTSAPEENIADLRTKGWELAFEWRDNIGDINYNIGFNLFDSKTKITKFDNTSGLLSQYYEGMNVNEQWGYTTDRFYNENDFDSDGKLKPGIAKVEGFNPNIGDILYVDYNGDGIINGGSNTLDNPGDMKIIGDRTRRYQYGITGGFKWKELSFSFILQGVGKRDIWYSNELFWPWYDEWSTLMKSQLNYWTPENTNAYFPRVYERAKGNTEANRLTQTKYKQNGSYLSIKNLTLSYSLPHEYIKNYRINSLSVFTSVEDLYNFNHLPKGMDPEAGAKSRGWTYPFLTKWSLGLRLGI